MTSPLQSVIAESYGVKTENTLTGFKWICGLLNEIEKENSERNFLFATEESFGYLNHSFVRDKDGVSTVALMSEMALHYKEKGMDLLDALDSLYEKYGFSHEHLINLVYKGKSGAEKITRIMAFFRNLKNESNLFGDELESIDDFQEKQTLNVATQKKIPIDMPTSNVLGFHFKSGDKLYLRPSGTEPKIKFYLMNQVKEGSLSDKKAQARKKTESWTRDIHNMTEEI